jgi:transposase
VEGAAGLGHLLAQQLVAAGERVLDVPPKLAARVRLLQAGDTNKNDPNDAYSVAVAALRSRARRQEVTAEDHGAVLKIWARRHRDLARSRNQAACRLHALLCDLVPGGVAGEITAARAARLLDQAAPGGPVAAARAGPAAEFLAGLRRLDGQRRECGKKLATAVRASGTSLTGLFGVGPVIAGLILGDVRDVTGSPAGTTSPPATAPPPSRSPPAAGRSTGCRCAATGGSTTPSTWRRSPSSATHTAAAAPTTTARSPRGRPTRRRCGA